MNQGQRLALSVLVLVLGCGSAEQRSSVPLSEGGSVEASGPEARWREQELWEPAFEGEEIPLETSFLGVFPAESVRDAIPIYERILAGVRGLFGNKDLRVARGLVFLATLHEGIGELGTAEQRYHEALEIVRDRYPGHADHGGVANNFGLFYARHSKPVEAFPLLREAIDVAETLQGADRKNLAIAHQNLAALHLTLGELSSAQRSFLLALEAEEALPRPDPHRKALLQQNFALVALSFGEAERARDILRDTLALTPALSGVEQAALHNSLAETLIRSGQRDQAETELQRALQLARPQGELFATVLGNLGRLHQEEGAFDRAEAELARALELLRAHRGPSSATVAALEMNLAMARLGHGDLEAARTGVGEALANWTSDPTRSPFITAGLLETAAALELELGNRPGALERARRAQDLKQSYLESILAAGSEEQRLEFLSSAAPHDLLANLGEPEPLAAALFSGKGAVLDALLQDRLRAFRGAEPESRRLLERIAALKRRRMALWLAAAQAPGNAGDGEQIQRELSEAESQLAVGRRRSAVNSPAARVGLREVQAAIKGDEALVDFVRYQTYRGKGQVEAGYGAVVLGATGPPSWIPLGPAEPIDQDVRALRELLRCDPGSVRAVVRLAGPCEDGAGTLDEKLAGVLERLGAAIWRPLRDRVPAGVHRLFLSPDSELHFVPFVVLPLEDGSFLGERFVLSYLTSGRDLLQRSARPQRETVLIYAPSDGGAAANPSAGLRPLPATREEAEQIRQLAEGAGWRTEVRLGDQASDEHLRREQAPGILHLATHAFFGDELGVRAPGRAQGQLPMARGVIALAGGGAGLAAWRRGGGLPLERDGLLTAEEVTELPLEDTWLAVLSACETGAGEARAGEGVLGLRRGFALAGAQNLVFSLWAVDDRPTAQLMSSFYQHLFRERDPALALNRAQTERLRGAHGGGSLFVAVREAAGFVASSSGIR